MTGKERMLSAFQHKEGDRVPIYTYILPSDVIAKIWGKKVYLSGSTSLHYEEAKAWMKGEEAHQEFEEKLWEELIKFTKYFELDAVGLPWRLKEKPTRQLDEYNFLYGEKNKKGWHINRYDAVSQTFGVVDSWRNHLQPEEVPEIVGEMEKEFSNRSPLKKENFFETKKLLDIFGKKLVVLGGGGLTIGYTPAFLEATILYSEAIEKYLDIQVAGSLEAIKIQAKMGIKVVCGGGDMASKNGPFYSPSIFHKFMLPRLRKITNLCGELGIYYLFISDGNLWPIAEDLFGESGIHGYGEIEGDAGMDLGKLKKEHGHLTFWGNISCHTLRTGTKEKVIKKTKNCIDKAAKGGGYIFGTSNAVLSGTPVENIIAMYETAKEYGKY